ncbi:hypothetical protein ACFL6N_04365 [Thermodesulfobacteriota bacterium]
MPPTEDIQPQGERIRKAVRWISDMVLTHPEKKRADIIRQAEIKFDLTPKECTFLNREIETNHPPK